MNLRQPIRGERIAAYDLHYARARTLGQMHQLLLRNLTDDVDRNSGESFHAKCRQIAKMTGRRTSQIRRALGNPGSLSLDLVADILWALDGALISCPDVERPLAHPIDP